MASIRAELRFLSSTGNADPLETYRPEPPFGFGIHAIVGPLGSLGEESFGFMVCTPDWFASEHLRVRNSVVSGRHFIFVSEFNYPALEKFVRDYCASCEGESWREVAEKVARLGYWEFEDYKPSSN
jgi:hypothetical protein